MIEFYITGSSLCEIYSEQFCAIWLIFNLNVLELSKLKLSSFDIRDIGNYSTDLVETFRNDRGDQ